MLHKIAAAILFVVGLGLLGSAYVVYKEEQAVLEWPKVDAKILRSGVEEFVDVSRNVDTGIVTESVKFRTDVLFEYTWSGTVHTSDRLTPLTFSSSSRDMIANQLADFPEGAEVSAHVNQEDPAVAVLKPDPSFLPLALLTMGILFLAITGLALIFGRRFHFGWSFQKEL